MNCVSKIIKIPYHCASFSFARRMSKFAALFYIIGCVVSCTGAHMRSFYHSNGSCNISWADIESKSNFQKAVNEEYYLIFMHISFVGENMAINGSSKALDASRWVRTRGRYGSGLMFLKEDFEILSLYSLSFGVKRLNINLLDTPKGCFTKSRIYADLQNDLSRLMLTDFDFQSDNKSGSSWHDDEQVCNFRISRDGKPEYVCCQFNDERNLEYYVLEADVWISVLVTCIFVLTVILALYSPKMIPVNLYNIAHGEECFEHKMPTKLGINILKTRQMHEKGDNIVLDSMILKKMPNLAKCVETMAYEEEKRVTLDKIHIKVMKRRLIPENDVPVNALYSLYESLVQCQIRRDEAFTDCCNSKIFPCGVFQFRKQWFDILRVIMHFILVCVICVPYVLRLLFYYYVEKQYIDYLKDKARERGWTYNVIFTGSLTSWLGPDHPLLLVFYSVVLLAVLIMFPTMCVGRNIACDMTFVLRNCLRDMNNKLRQRRVINWAVKVFLSPFTFLGFGGFLLAPFYWIIIIPLEVIILICNIFPAIYLLIRIVVSFFLPYLFDVNEDVNSKRHFRFGIKKTAQRIKSFEFIRKWLYMDVCDEIREGTYLYQNRFDMRYNICLQAIFTIFYTCVVLSVLFLTLDVILLVLEMIVYIFIGIILNALYVFRYVILALSLIFYARDCFSGVRKKYLAFNKVILQAVRDGSEGVTDVANLDEKDQPNTAFIPKVANKKPQSPSIVLKNGTLTWKLHQVILFLDKSDIPYITESFFFKTCEMPYDHSPGQFLENFIKALFEVFMIFIFLVFVSLVVLAFGNNFEISPMNRTLATIGGSFLTILLRRYVFKDHSTFDINTTQIKFTTCLNETIGNFTEEWPVSDIVPSDTKDDVNVKHDTNNDANVKPPDTKDGFVGKSDNTIDDKNDVDILASKLVIVCDKDKGSNDDDWPRDSNNVVINMGDTDAALAAETYM